MHTIHSRIHSHDDADRFWRKQYSWLAEQGYTLRPKYMTSWAKTGMAMTSAGVAVPDLKQGVAIDAIRTIDGKLVALKRVCVDASVGEFSLACYFNALKYSARNHCVPVFDVLPIPDEEREVLIVMPLLRTFDEPRFETFGETIAFFTQLFEASGIAHRHIMMDATPLYPHAFDPLNPTMRRDWQGKAKPRSRTKQPVRYYFVDFAHARSGHTWDSSVTQARYAADVYDLGDMLRTNFFNKYDGFEFMYPLLADMLEPDPAKRPSAERLYAHFLMARAQLSSAKSRSRLIERGGEPALTAAYRNCRHWLLTVGRLLLGVPAVPDA
ncbi:hypothetical protein K488DRAFT_63044 [Vararia minispora EC-137]|uniref:Uncharacterized protein n=1 Tax=Vararia minispora EC-137 TaxID=1314806 RepID=A0ACB8Q5M5_9AGAM|nr:hypothetical protein K488DRAFT_63044 [Vararia minispora EC-137]